MAYMDPSTGLMIDGDPPEPATGMVGAQNDLAASAPSLPDVGPPAPAAPDVSDAPSPEPPPAPVPPAAPELPFPEPSGLPLSEDMPGADQAPEGTTAPVVPESMNAEPPKPVVPSADPAELTAQEIENVRTKGAEDAKRAEIEAKAARESAERAAQHEKDAAAIKKTGEEAYARERNRQNQELERQRQLGEKDVWGDNSTMNKVLAGIAIFLGGRPAASFIVGAINGLEQNKKEAIAASAKRAEELGKSAEEIDAHTRRQMADLDIQVAAGADATAARMKKDLAARGVPISQINTNADILAVQQKANDARAKAEKDAHKEAEDKIKDDLAKNKDKWQAAEAEARTKELGLRTHKPYGTGTGKGGGGDAAMTAFVNAANALKPGDQIPPEVSVLARHAGFKPDQIAGAVDKYRGSGAKAANEEKKAGGEADTKDIADQMKTYATLANGTSRSPGPVRVLSQIEAMRNGLEEAAASGDSDRIKAAVIKAKEQAGTLMSGGKMTDAQNKLMHELESTADGLTATIGKFTGNPTEGKGLVKRLGQIIDDAGNETVHQIADIRQRAINQHLAPGGAANTPEKKNFFINRHNGLFSEVKWKGTKVFDSPGVPATPPTAATPVGDTAAYDAETKRLAGTKKQPTPEDMKAAAQRVSNDPNAPATARARAIQYLNANP